MEAQENELVTLNPDREKVIKGLECCTTMDEQGFPSCEKCPYDVNGTCPNLDALHRDALMLLKAQEPIKPYLDFDGLDVMRCGACNTSLIHITYTDSDEDMRNYVKYCKHCGRAVKWDD